MEYGDSKMECTILMPCLNEEANIAYVIDQAREWMAANDVEGEILIVDNGSVMGEGEKRTVDYLEKCF